MNRSELRTPIAKVRGLGSAKSGTSHFIWQRITALLLIPLTFWLISSLLYMTVSPDSQIVEQWMGSSINTALMVFFLLALFYHAALGMQVVIEDYVHSHGCKLTALFLNLLFMSGFAIISILAVLELHFSGTFAEAWG